MKKQLCKLKPMISWPVKQNNEDCLPRNKTNKHHWLILAEITLGALVHIRYNKTGEWLIKSSARCPSTFREGKKKWYWFSFLAQGTEQAKCSPRHVKEKSLLSSTQPLSKEKITHLYYVGPIATSKAALLWSLKAHQIFARRSKEE